MKSILNLFFKKKEEVKEQSGDGVKFLGPHKQFPPSLSFPELKDGAPRAYVYSGLQIIDPDTEEIKKLLYAGKYEIKASSEGDKIKLLSGNICIGYFGDIKKDMLLDWIKRNDPYVMYLSSSPLPSVRVAFYKDKQPEMKWRDHEVIKLVAYSGREAQESLSCAFPGQEVDLDDDGDVVLVGDMGKLPKKAAEKYIEEGAAGCFIDRIEYDEEKDKYIPYVVIYW